MKRWIIFLFSLLLMGCSRTAPQQTLTITMSLGENEWQVLRRDVLAPFEKKHNLRINAYQIESAQLATKLEALQIAGKSEIDLFAQDNMSLAALINKDLILDLTEYAEQIPPEIIPNLIQSCKFNQRLLFMPFRPNVQIVYYNEEKFKKYNLRLPRSWDELLGTARRFKEEENEGRVLLKAFGGNPTATQLYEFILQAGGNPYSFNDQGCVQAFTFLQSLWPYVSEESQRAKWDTTNDILARQQAYLAQNWPFGIVVLIQQYQLPFIKTYSGWRGPAGEYHVIGGDVFGIAKNTRNKTLALKFIRYMQSKQVQQTLASKLGWPSIRQDAYAEVAQWQRPHYAVIQQALKHGVFRKNVTWWPAYVKYITAAFREIVINNTQVTATLNKYKEKLEKEKSLF